MTKIDLNTVSSSALLDLLDACDAFGIEHHESPRLEREFLLNPLQRIDESQLISLWNEIVRNTPIPHIGLSIGQRINPQAKGLLASWVSQCETLGEAILIFQQHISLMSPSEAWLINKVKSSEQQAYIQLVFSLEDHKNYPVAAIERSMSALVAWGQVLTGESLQPHKVTFNFSAPSYVDQYESIFGAAVEFSCAENSLLFPADVFELAIKSANPLLKEMIQVKAKEAFNALDEGLSMSNKVRTLIETYLVDKKASIDYISQILCMSRQTVYRRLKQEGTDFKTLLNEVRKDKSVILLLENNANLEYVSLSLGFNDTSSFYKAFQRWYELSPAEYLIKHANSPSV